MTADVEAIAQDLRQRIDAQVAEQVDARIPSDNELEQQIRDMLPDLLGEDSEFVRKLRFGSETDKLAGSKYARAGLAPVDIEWLHDFQRSLKGQRRTEPDGSGVYTGPSDDLDKAFKAVSSGTYLSNSQALSADLARIEDQRERGILNQQAYQRAIKAAMDTAESGYGSQLIGAQYVSELWRGARAQSTVFSLIPTFEMTDPTAYLPVEADIPELLFVSESTSSSATNYTTSKTGSNRVQVDAKKFVIHQMWSGEMEEDSIIPYIPFLREQAARALAYYSDSLVLNGDTTNAATGNINLDDADPADTKHYLAFDGIRHACIVDNTANATSQGAAIDYASLIDTRSLMLDRTYLHDWGHPTDPTDLVYVGTPEVGDSVAKLSEVLTVDKYGSNATVLTGEVGNVGRHPFVTTVAMSRTEADGKVSTTGGNNTKDAILLFNRRGYTVGWRRRVMVETERLPATDQTRIVYSMRLGFGRFSPTGAASGIESAALLYNIG